MVQDLKISTDNTRLVREKYYSPSEKKTYLAALPAGYEGAFGPGIKALTLVLYFGANVTEPKILAFFHYFEVQISAGQLSAFLIKKQERFHAEKDALYQAALASSLWQQIDDTGTRVNGQNQCCQILCNSLYTAYFTTEKKDRLTIIDVLQNLRERTFVLNDETYQLLQSFHLPNHLLPPLMRLPQQQKFNEADFVAQLEKQVPTLGPQQQSRVLEAAAIAAYHAQTDFPVVKLLLSDDAPQFKLVSAHLALCWIHDGRHYKKLMPAVAYHQQLLDTFLGKFWGFYHHLLAYKENPTAADRVRLAQEFDVLFSIPLYGTIRRLTNALPKPEPRKKIC